MELWDAIVHWMAAWKTELFWIGVGSTAILALTILAMPWLLAWIPQNYFVVQENRFKTKEPRSLGRSFLNLLRNIVGAMLVLLGIAMLALPGPGIVTLLLGVMIMCFPGKYRLERWLVKQPKVLESINWLRNKRNAPPLRLEKER